MIAKLQSVHFSCAFPCSMRLAVSRQGWSRSACGRAAKSALEPTVLDTLATTRSDTLNSTPAPSNHAPYSVARLLARTKLRTTRRPDYEHNGITIT